MGKKKSSSRRKDKEGSRPQDDSSPKIVSATADGSAAESTEELNGDRSNHEVTEQPPVSEAKGASASDRTTASTSAPSAKTASSSQSLFKQDKPLFWCSVAVVAIMLARLTHAVILHPLRIGWDPALHLQAAQLIVKGKIPYVDMFDANPPLVWYLDTIPAYLSEVLNFPVTQSFNYFLVGIIAYSAIACLVLFFTRGKRFDAPYFLPFLIGLTLFNFFLRYDFGQREEIFVLLYMPFFVLRWLRWQGCGVESSFWSSVIGVIAAIGISLKHYFLIPAALVELFFLLDKRKPSRLLTYETIACFLGGVIYMAHFLFVPAAMRENYFHFLVPAFSLGYQFWDTALGAALSEPSKRDVFFLLSVSSLLAVALRKKCSILLPLTVFLMGGMIPYLLQFKGWSYHDQPVFAAGFILASLEVGYFAILISEKIGGIATAIGAKAKVRLKLPRKLVLSGIALAALGIAVYDGNEDYKVCVNDPRHFDMSIIGYSGMSPWADIFCPYTELVLEDYKLGDKIVFMSNAVSPGYPFLTQLRFDPGSRHLHMVILSVLSYIKDICPHTKENIALFSQADRIVDEYAEDIRKNKPKFVFMQKGPDYFVAPYDFINKYLKEDYDELEGIENFRVFKRKSGH